MRVLARRASHGEGAHVVALRKRHAVVLRKGHVVALAQGFCWGLHRAHPNQGDMYCGDGARVFAAGRVLFRGRFCDFPGTIRFFLSNLNGFSSVREALLEAASMQNLKMPVRN